MITQNAAARCLGANRSCWYCWSLFRRQVEGGYIIWRLKNRCCHLGNNEHEWIVHIGHKGCYLHVPQRSHLNMTGYSHNFQEKGTLGHLQVERGQQEVRRCGAQWCPGSVHRSSRLDIKPDKYIVKLFNNISNKINSVSYLFGYMYLHIPLKYPAISFISASPRLKSARARAASTPGPAHLQYYPEL